MGRMISYLTPEEAEIQELRQECHQLRQNLSYCRRAYQVQEAELEAQRRYSHLLEARVNAYRAMVPSYVDRVRRFGESQHGPGQVIPL